MVLNTGSRPAVIAQGTVLAHAAPLPVEERLVAQADFTVESHPPSDEGTEWLDSLCAGSANLSKVQLGALRGLQLEFADVFSKHKYDIGCTDLLRHHIATGDAAPIRQNPFRLSPAEKEHGSQGSCGSRASRRDGTMRHRQGDSLSAVWFESCSVSQLGLRRCVATGLARELWQSCLEERWDDETSLSVATGLARELGRVVPREVMERGGVVRVAEV
ncbi:unnamed protein product [Lampetra fluviatilis]